MKVEISGFRTEERSPRHYEKVKVDGLAPTEEEMLLMGRALARCIGKGCHTASVRIVHV